MMMKNDSRPPLPTSLKQKRYKRIIIRVGICCLLLAISIILVASYKTIIFSSFTSKFGAIKVIFIGAFLCIPFLVSGVPLKLIDSSWSGTVYGVVVEENTGTYTVGGTVWPYSRQDIVLLIEKDGGKKVKYTAFSLGVKEGHWEYIPAIGKIENHITKFEVGDRVHKYYGYKYLYIVPSAKCDEKRCLVCGQYNDHRRTSCLNCKAELI